MTTLIQHLSSFAADTRFADLPDEVVASIRLRILDTLGVALAAWSGDNGQALFGLVAATGGRGEAAPIGWSSHLPAENAVFVSGTLAHGLDFDDTHLPSVLHPSATVVPVALTAAQVPSTECSGEPPTPPTGKDVLTAAAVGYEICIRLGLAAYDPELRNSVFFEKGLHAVPLCGALAAAAIATKLQHGDTARIGHAMGIAASMASGLLEANRTGGTVKQLHGGWACHAGIWAAKLAAAGFTGPPTVLEGRFGFFHALADNRFDPQAITAGLGTHWEIPGIFYKPYPANHFTHAGIDAALGIRTELGTIGPDDVESIELGVATPTLRTVAEPRASKIAPESGYAARFSGPFTVATALLGGGGLGVSLDDFTDDLARDPVRRALAAKVVPYGDEACDAVFPYQFPAVLRVHLSNGRTIERRVMQNRGSPQRPLTEEELRTKFNLNVSRVLPEQQATTLADLCSTVDQIPTIDPLIQAWTVDDAQVSNRRDAKAQRYAE